MSITEYKELKKSDVLEKAPNCWSFNDCPEEICAQCPAYPDHGKECWKVTGTKCANGRYISTSLAEKILYCRNECKFYRTYLKKYFI